MVRAMGLAHLGLVHGLSVPELGCVRRPPPTPAMDPEAIRVGERGRSERMRATDRSPPQQPPRAPTRSQPMGAGVSLPRWDHTAAGRRPPTQLGHVTTPPPAPWNSPRQVPSYPSPPKVVRAHCPGSVLAKDSPDAARGQYPRGATHPMGSVLPRRRQVHAPRLSCQSVAILPTYPPRPVIPSSRIP